MRYGSRWSVNAWAAAAVLAGFLWGSAWANSRSDEWDAVLSLVERIKAEPAITRRTGQAEALSDVVWKKAGKPAPRRAIRALAGMMEDRDDSVRYWMAMALGYLGPQAADAIPALEKALEEIEGRRGSKTSESAIRLALKRIGVPSK